MWLNSRTTFPLVLEHELCTNAAAIITIIPPSIMFLSELLSLDSGHLRWLLPGKGWSCLETFAPYFWLLLLQCSICLTSGLHWVSRAVLHRARTFNDVCKCERSLNKTLGGRRENKHGDFVEWKNKLETDKHGDFKGSTSDVHSSCLYLSKGLCLKLIIFRSAGRLIHICFTPTETRCSKYTALTNPVPKDPVSPLIYGRRAVWWLVWRSV